MTSLPKARDTLKIKEVSNWNQAQILLLRQDDFLTKAHQLHDMASRIEDGKNLLAALSAFKHAILTTKWALAEDDRKSLNKKLKAYEDRLALFLSRDYQKANQDPQAIKDYADLYTGLYELFDIFYQAQQNIRLGIPKERKMDSPDLLEQRMRQ